MSSGNRDFEEARRAWQAERRRALQLRLRARLLGQRMRGAHRILLEMTDAARRNLEAMRMARVLGKLPLAAVARSAPPCALLQALAVGGLGEGDLDDVTDGLIAAYQTAVDRGDVEMQAPLREALLLAGRHLAARMGPKAAGLRMH